MSSPLLTAERAPALSPNYLLAALLLHGLAVALLPGITPHLPPAEPPPALSFRVIQPAADPSPEPPKPVARELPAPRRVSKAPPLPTPAPLLNTPATKAPVEVPLDQPPPRTDTALEPAPVVPAVAPTPAAASRAETAPRFDADYLDNPPPAYPAVSRRMGEEGKVVLRVFVEPSGRPGQIQIHTGSGSARLDQAAQESVARWKFVPAHRGAEPVGAWVLVPIQFSLRS